MLKTIVFAALAVAVLADDMMMPLGSSAQVDEIVRAYCKKNNAEDKVEQVKTSGKNFIDCVKGLIDVATLQREIEEAKPNGALDEVFRKYCAKAPQLKTCIFNLLEGVSPCADASLREHKETFKNGTTQMIDFVCFKDGDRIAMFIAEGGPQCFQSQANDIRSCANNLRQNVEATTTLTLTERCAKFDELTTCVVSKLEKCTSPTPGNMAEALFSFVRKGSPCQMEKGA